MKSNFGAIPALKGILWEKQSILLLWQTSQKLLLFETKGNSTVLWKVPISKTFGHDGELEESIVISGTVSLNTLSLIYW